MRRLIFLALLLAPLASAQDVPGAFPEQARVTYTDDGLTIHMSVAAPFVGVSPVVQYSGDANGEATMEQVGFVATTFDRPVGTTVYAATVALQPGQTISYQAGHITRGFTPERTVSMPPPAGDVLRIVSFGDIGIDGVAANGATQAAGEAAAMAIQVRDLAIAQDADLALLSGDLAYDNTQPGWDTFLRMQEPLQSTVPTILAIGNHEWNDNLPEFGYTRFTENYVLPGNEEDFLVRAGDATIIVMNSDALCEGDRYRTSYGHEAEPCPYGEPDLARAARLDSMLAEADVDDQAWTILMWHHPHYSWGRHGSDVGQQILWGPILDAHNVDLVLTSHDHLYSRSYPVHQGEPVQWGNEYTQGPGAVHVVQGGGGRSLYNLPDANINPAPAWHAKGLLSHGVSVVEASPGRLDYRAVGLDSDVYDSFSIARADPAPAPTANAPALGVAFAVALVFLAAMRR